MKLAQIMTYKTAFEKIKSTLKENGLDVSGIRYITDLEPVLATILPEELAEKAQALLADGNALAALLEAFTGAADAGVLVNALYRPSDEVKEEDLYA